MYRSVEDYIKGCAVFQKIKAETMAPTSLLQPLPIPYQVWDDISLDFIEGLPTSQGKDTIMVVIDMFSKSAHFLPLTHPFTAKTMALWKELSSSTGCPFLLSMTAIPFLLASFGKNSSSC
jgi:hypothetical protein